MLADYPVYAAPLQLIAFVPFLLVMRRCDRASAAVAGAVLAFRFIGFAPALGALPLLAGVGVLAYVFLLHTACGLACFGVRGVPEPWRSLAIGAAFAGMELVDSRLPMWGTGLSLACAWSPYPSAIQVIRVTGPLGVAFLVVSAQSLALAMSAAKSRSRRIVIAGVLAALLAFGGLASLGARRPSATLRVAALGWADRSGPSRLDELIVEAASRGARLVVAPEAALEVHAGAGEREALFARMEGIARRHGVFLAIAFIDHEREENRLVFFAPDGSVAGGYTKTHLVPTAESTKPGNGKLVVVEIDGVKVGGMICQDDNFTDITRGYARAGARIIVSPTFEMSASMGALHLRNALLRPIESGLGYVRAAANGTSAIVSSAGTIVASYDHARSGGGVVVADVPYSP
jgi:apolipoprotein N-acyltransferase